MKNNEILTPESKYIKPTWLYNHTGESLATFNPIR